MVKISVAAFTFSTFSAAATFAVYAIRRFFPKPLGNVTGTSDELPVEAQLKMIREILPDAKTIGILYTTSEANSVYSLSLIHIY